MRLFWVALGYALLVFAVGTAFLLVAQVMFDAR